MFHEIFHARKALAYRCRSQNLVGGHADLLILALYAPGEEQCDGDPTSDPTSFAAWVAIMNITFARGF